MSAPLSPYTSVYVGARYQVACLPDTRTEATGDYEEVAGFAGIRYTFK